MSAGPPPLLILSGGLGASIAARGVKGKGRRENRSAD